MVVRPLSGPAALGMAVDLMREYGADSFIGLLSARSWAVPTLLFILWPCIFFYRVYKTRYAIKSVWRQILPVS